MLEILFFLIVLGVLRALRSRPPREVHIHVHHHLPPSSPGESRPAEEAAQSADRVVPFRRRSA